MSAVNASLRWPGISSSSALLCRALVKVSDYLSAGQQAFALSLQA
jgi:hypothetical protein